MNLGQIGVKQFLLRANVRILLVFLHDIVAAIVCWVTAYWLRFNLSLPPQYLEASLRALIWVLPLQVFFFWRFGLYRGIWRFASLTDLQRILKAIGIGAIAVPVGVVMFQTSYVVPRSVLLLDPLLLLLVMGGSRLLYRSWKEHRIATLLQPETRPVLILGGGNAAASLIRDISRHGSGFRVVGVLCDRKHLYGRDIHGVPVLGSFDDVGLWIDRMRVEDVIVALPEESAGKRKQLVEICQAKGMQVLTAPTLDDLIHGRVSLATLRPIAIDDLLGREPVQLDAAGLQGLLSGQVVMVTGAGGSIGSELCRQISTFHPSRLVLVENGEYALYQMEQEFKRASLPFDVSCLLGDIKDAARMEHLMAQFQPDVIYHAAAYKHVPLLEQGNGLQALKNNVLGTWITARAAQKAGVKRFVMISTDKAVNPTNIMGASKRLAEMACRSLVISGEGNASVTNFVSVRFGNVLGSSGSVIPKFQQQIMDGGPVTVTHPDMTRYFMSIPEAAQLVLQASLLGKDHEIFVLEMGEPVRIIDLARMMIRLAGKDEREISIEITGLRPGEKLFEELVAESEATLATPHRKLRVIRANTVDRQAVEEMLSWIEHTSACPDAAIRDRLQFWLPEYRPRVEN